MRSAKMLIMVLILFEGTAPNDRRRSSSPNNPQREARALDGMDPERSQA